MATIRARRQANGSTRYTAYVRIRRGKAILHTEAKTFSHRSAAVSWARHREIVLEDPSSLTRVHQGTPTHAEFGIRHVLGSTDALTLSVPASARSTRRLRKADSERP